MTKLVQISILLIIVLLSEVNSVTIFQGFSLKKGIDISLIPFPIKPITFIKEKWSPFGSFGIKHEIARRQVINNIEPGVIVTPVPVVVPSYIIPEVPRPEHPPVAPVVEHHEEIEIAKENVDHASPEVPIITPPVAPVVENEVVSEVAAAPTVVEVVAPVEPVEHVAVTPAEPPPVLITPVPPIPIQAPPITPVIPTPVSNKLNTDISRVAAINEYLNSVGKSGVPVLVAPVAPPVKENDSPSLLSSFLSRGGLRTGSKLAIQLGSAFLHFMTQAFNNPQSPLARYAE